MGSWMRRLRGVVGTAAVWAAGWFGFSAIVWGISLFGDVPIGLIVNLALGVGVAGALAGAGFAIMLGLAEGSRTLDELSYLRLALWGAVGGVLVGLPFLGSIGSAGLLPIFGLLASLGATSASGSLALARMADDGAAVREGSRRLTLSGSGE